MLACLQFVRCPGHQDLPQPCTTKIPVLILQTAMNSQFNILIHGDPGSGFFFKKINDPSSKCPGRIVPGLSNFGLGLCTATIDLGPSPCSYALSDGSPPRSFLLVGHSVTSAMSKYWRIHNRRSTRLYYPIASLVLPCP